MDKQTAVLIVGHDTALSEAIKSLVNSMNEEIVLVAEAKEIIYEIHNYPQPNIELNLKPQETHGHYRKFIKQNKRKNIKAHK